MRLSLLRLCWGPCSPSLPQRQLQRIVDPLSEQADIIIELSLGGDGGVEGEIEIGKDLLPSGRGRDVGYTHDELTASSPE